MSFGAPAAAFLGALIGHVISRKGATELDMWRRREETMRMLRWAAELAVSDTPLTAQLGVAALRALNNSELLQREDRLFVDLIADAVLDLDSGVPYEDASDDIDEIP